MSRDGSPGAANSSNRLGSARTRNWTLGTRLIADLPDEQAARRHRGLALVGASSEAAAAVSAKWGP